MASANVAEWVAKNIRHTGVDVLELGSKRYKDHAYLDLREILQKRGKPFSYTGCDLAAGEPSDCRWAAG